MHGELERASRGPKLKNDEATAGEVESWADERPVKCCSRWVARYDSLQTEARAQGEAEDPGAGSEGDCGDEGGLRSQE